MDSPRALTAVAACCWLLSACASPPPAAPRAAVKAAPAPVPPPAAPPPDPVAQRRAYERGVELFAREHYDLAEEAWREAVRRGPDTQVGRRARANLRKVRAVIKNLQKLEEDP